MMDGGKDQIMHMTNFILHEARNCAQVRTASRARGWQAQEKADEVSAKAEQDYTMEKQRVVEDEKLKASVRTHCEVNPRR